MRHWVLSSVTALLLATGPAAAFDISAMSDAERETFRKEIRDYLLDNPEVIFEAVQILEQRQQQAQAAAEKDVIAANATAIFDDGYSWVGGNPDGDVTLVEFMDYRCSFCRRAVPEVDKLLANDGNIRLVIKEFPILGDQSVIMSRFAIATHQVAGDEAYKQVHDVLMATNGDVNDARLRRIAGDLGLDADAIMAQMDAPEVTQIIARNRDLAQSLNISGTPSFVVGDEILRGFLPADQMELIVDDKRG
ncbi:DsbA family protein [Aestuariivita boseongensis]|uniref:DsbA family protein n=1 Tax=Aestuariivita boseongensis TaxID=1470562 RepID=UPI000AF50108|nr:DsbA family protein [Aestuariivita boseongensis]